MSFFSCLYFSKRGGVFLEQFYFYNKIKRKVQRFPICSLTLHVHSVPHYQHHFPNGPFLFEDKPTLTPHNHPRCTECCTAYGFEQMYSGSQDPLLLYHTEYFAVLKLLCALPIYPHTQHSSEYLM